MTPDEVRAAIEAFVSLCDDSGLSTPEAEQALPLILDRIALALHYVDEPEWRFVEASPLEYESVRALISKRFPDFGLYNVADPLSDLATEAALSVGDAIDDLSDIYSDLKGVVLHWRNQEDNRAIRVLSATHAFHWESHLRELQVYLCARARTHRTEGAAA